MSASFLFTSITININSFLYKIQGFLSYFEDPGWVPMLCKVVWGQGSFSPCHILWYVVFIIRRCTSCILLYCLLLFMSRGFWSPLLYLFIYFSCIYYCYYLHVAQNTLPYLTQPLLSFRFLNPQNPALYDFL